ncbi:3-deoxy-D-arabinoheptulosonate-7-phosphate synthase /chorismate mutase [Marininema halotolerans]|uniref:3-deoxy-D-arabinoheptulosonate-7-phosphate synthase /chorismate mutase n=2 Tax=Marininema halotolerans TaxID=1155944 RepID=A0A1I6PV47_9BACL|nr:3-deoxy-D-arabinoheptulosonate-7-phosphate synthase /chorismate mutase [Marininema halotolerans]
MSMSEELNKLRAQIDEVNGELLTLLSRRAELTKQIGDVKVAQGVNRFDPVRERDMLDMIVASNPGPFDNDTIRHLFKQIFKASLDLQQQDHQKVLLVSRKRQPEDTVVAIGDTVVGAGEKTIVAGPCSVETEEQVMKVAQSLSEQGVSLLRGGAFKPRTSPYDFQGLGETGLAILRRAADAYGLKVISEIVNPSDMEMAARYVDVVQIGARNMQNFELLKAAGDLNLPVFLKRGMSATVEEFLFAAEYIVSRGNSQVILCERGIRTYEKWTRNTLDISAVPLLKQESHLPVFVDITHSIGRRDIQIPIAKAALAAGADGLMLEVHPDPAVALSDANQQIDIPQFESFMDQMYSSGLVQREDKLVRS